MRIFININHVEWQRTGPVARGPLNAKLIKPISITFAPLTPGSSPGDGAQQRDGVGVPRVPEGRRV